MRVKVLLPALCAVVAACFLSPALAQEQLRELSASAPARRGPVAFDHNAHNEKAGLDDCAQCHHLYKDGKLVPGEASVEKKCSDCHLRGAASGTSLMNAYHRRCMGCHKAQKKGPVACGRCHAKRPQPRL